MGASERDERLRAAWRVMVATSLDVRRLVFVDECGTHTSGASLRLGAAWPASVREGAAQPRPEHDAASEYFCRGHGAVRGGRGNDDR